MKKSLLISILAVGPMLAVSTGCATSRTASGQLGDQATSRNVAAKLSADPDIRRLDIDVDTLEGVVTLRGTVKTQEQKELALAVAKNTSGVRGVVDELQIGDPGVGSATRDAWISTKVKSKFAVDLETRTFNIDVDTEQGVVTLSGIVATRYAKDKAERLAKATKGVREVKNQLRVRGEQEQGQQEQPEQQGQQEQPEQQGQQEQGQQEQPEQQGQQEQLEQEQLEQEQPEQLEQEQQPD